MHLLDQRVVGIVIVLLLGMLLIVKRLATGSVPDNPSDGLLVRLVNTFNLSYC